MPLQDHRVPFSPLKYDSRATIYAKGLRGDRAFLAHVYVWCGSSLCGCSSSLQPRDELFLFASVVVVFNIQQWYQSLSSPR